MILAMLRWWYGTGWLQAAHRVSLWTKSVEQIFSVSILLKTLFSPWHRIMTSPGKSLDAKVQAGLDNFISRLVGGAVRSAVLFAAFVSIVGVLFGSLFMAGIWPLLPPAMVYFVIRSITG